MRIKFLETTPSASPDAPFQAGQIIDVDTPSPEMILALAVPPGGTPRAIRLPDDAVTPEAAVVPDATERAVLPRAKARRS